MQPGEAGRVGRLPGGSDAWARLLVGFEVGQTLKGREARRQRPIKAEDPLGWSWGRMPPFCPR